MQSEEEDATAGRSRSSTLVNRNVTIRGRRTSLRLEPAMWDALHEIALREGRSVHELCTEVDLGRQESTLTAAIRVYILGYFRAAATPQGHSLAGHGQPRGIGGMRNGDAASAGASSTGSPSTGGSPEAALSAAGPSASASDGACSEETSRRPPALRRR